MEKHTILKGTFWLTITGFLTRLIGFFYKIYLAEKLGAEQVGVYQLIFPIYGMCFTLYGSGLQTGISTLIAAEHGKYCQKNDVKIVRTGILFSICIACSLSVLLYYFAPLISHSFLREPRCSNCLRILAILFPFCGITACINGYYYGIQKITVPATTQLIEQLVRVGSVCFLTCTVLKAFPFSCELAVLGIVLGEIASNIWNIGSLFFLPHTKRTVSASKEQQPNRFLTALLRLSIPLTGNRLLIGLLQSVETILIPIMLQNYGFSHAKAMSLYGILTGMAMPFILFPSTITNSLAVMLLPAVSKAQAAKEDRFIHRTASLSMKYSLLIGLFSTAIFIVFGNFIGSIVFHNLLAGKFLMTLAWLCPFLYLTTTFGSIINGLGKTHLTFLNSMIGLSVRILFILYLVPKQGVCGYLIGLLMSQLIITLLDFLALHKTIHFSFCAIDWILKPSICLFCLGLLEKFLSKQLSFHSVLHFFISFSFFCIGYLIFLLTQQILSFQKEAPYFSGRSCEK